MEEYPLLRITVFDAPKQYRSDFGGNSDDLFRIEEVRIATGESYRNSVFDVGDVIALKGYMKIVSGSDKIEGHFTLKLAEIK